MSPQDIAKDAIRLVTTAGLGKDVIDLLEKKVALLTEQIATLETENANLKNKVANLEQELNRVRPKGDLAEDAVRFLKLLFDQGRGLTITQIASALGIAKGLVEYHRDNLLNAKMIQWPIMIMGNTEPTLHLATAGRAYLVEHGHV